MTSKKEIENIERNRKILESYKRYMEYENNFFSAGKRREEGIFDIQNFSEEKYTVFDLGRGEKEKNTEKHIIRELKKYNCSRNILKKYFKNIKKESEIFIENFNSPIEVLRHLKNTGVTGFEKTEIKKIRSFSSAELTYKVGYFLCEK